ncbi:MAG: response regulator transcription factor [Proteobacteria bacterium]|nr:response regulator transcription factor [Pseudomonadota bacterium]MBU4470629.1 response regulator transcription factor [Pseudomonadota bacterium]MCG2753354.1 response regulator transcription factor [Desulfobacteraceae bacterium]
MAGLNKVVIVEDHVMFRDGLRELLKNFDHMEVVGEAGDGLEAIRCIKKHLPDLVLLDINMPKMDGLAVIHEIKKALPQVKIIVLTMFKEDAYVIEAFKAGAKGYCLKSSSFDELKMAIGAVLAGNRFISPEIEEKVMEGLLETSKKIKAKSAWDTLTQREKEVLKLVGEGYKNREISDYLCISEKTVEKHRANIMNKLDMHTASSLAAYAVEKGLVVLK